MNKKTTQYNNIVRTRVIMEHLKNQLGNFRRLFDTLSKDINKICGRSKTLSQTKRRTFIRAIFALVEVDAFKRKQIALLLHKLGNCIFDEAELLMLKEEQCDLKHSGKIRRYKKFLRLADNYCFGFRMFCKATGISYEVPVNSSGWQSFIDAIKIRNRITHPKSEEDIFISDDDLGRVIEAFKWFMDNTKGISEHLEGKLVAEE